MSSLASGRTIIVLRRLGTPLIFTTPPTKCEYLPDRLSQLRYEIDRDLDSATYMERLHQGWRRFGYAMFRPDCPSCSMCQSLRVPAEGFQPTRGQRRVWKKNDGAITLRIGLPAVSPERLALWRRFHRHGELVKGWPHDAGNTPGVILQTPFAIEEWTYHAGDTLVGVGYVDVLPAGLSAIYFYWDPDQQSRSLGTFNILSLLASARERRLPHVYLGYYVKGCRSLEYKARFAPSEVLRAGRWEQFAG
jgi:leucyl-tRNA---protein transferase